MASQIHFKFKSFMKEFESVSFSGMGMRLKDLKLAIADKKFRNESRDFDLSVTHAQTSQVFTNENELVPKNTQVIVKRTSAVNGKGLRAFAPAAARPSAAGSRGAGLAAGPAALELAGLDDVSRSLTVVGRLAEAAAVPGLDALAAQAAQGKGYKGGKGKGGQWGKGGGGKGGDDGQGDERRAPKGVPTKSLTFNEETGVALVRANVDKFQASRDKATTVDGDDAAGGLGSGPQDYGDALPPHLACPLCKGLVVDAVVLQWCRTSACDGCVRQAMRANDAVCPITGDKIKGYLDKLVPNKPLRRDAAAFDEQWRQQQQALRRERDAAAEAAAASTGVAFSGGSGDAGPLKRGVDAELDLFRRSSSNSGAADFNADGLGANGAANGGLLGGSLGGGGLYDDFLDDEIDFSAVDAAAAAAAAVESIASGEKSSPPGEAPSPGPAALAAPAPLAADAALALAAVTGPRPPPGPPPGFGFPLPPVPQGQQPAAASPSLPTLLTVVPTGRALEQCRDFARGTCMKAAFCVYAHGDKPGRTPQSSHSTPAPFAASANAALLSFSQPPEVLLGRPLPAPAPAFAPVCTPFISDTDSPLQPHSSSDAGLHMAHPLVGPPPVGPPPSGPPPPGMGPAVSYGKGGKGYGDYGKGKGSGKGFGYGPLPGAYMQGKGAYGKGAMMTGKGGKGAYGPGQMGKGGGPIFGNGGVWVGNWNGGGPSGNLAPSGFLPSAAGRFSSSRGGGYGDGPPQKRGKYGPDYGLME